MSHIFISYSRKDFDFAQKIVNALASNNLDTWIDWKSIPKGEDWEQEIYRGIEEADAFLFLISPDSVASQMCNKEIDHAIKNGKRILPIVLRDADLKSIHPEISKRNWIFCRDGQDDFTKAIEETRKTIHTDYGWLKYHTKLQVKALDWERAKDHSRLLRGKELREAEKQLAEMSGQEDPQPTRIQREYILASQRNEVRVRQQFIIGLSIGLIILAVIFVFALIQRDEAQRQATIALSRQLSSEAISIREKDLDLSFLLGIEAINLFQNPESMDTLLKNLQYSPFMQHLMHADSPVLSLDYSEKQNLLVATYADGSIKFWNVENVENPKQVGEIQTEHPNEFANVVLNAENATLILRYYGGMILWDVTDLKNPIRIAKINTVPDSTPLGVAISPDKKIIASADSAHSDQVALWEVSNLSLGNPYIFLDGHLSYITGVAFNSTGNILASSSMDGTVILWDLSSPKKPKMLGEPLRGTFESLHSVYSIALNSDDTILAVGDDLGFISLWNIAVPEHPQNLGSYALFTESGISSLAFSQGGEYLAAGNENGYVGFLYFETKEKIYTIGKPIASQNWIVAAMGFSSGNRLFSAGIMGESIVLWNMEHAPYSVWLEQSLPMGEYKASNVTFSPNGKILAVGSDKGLITFWDVTGNTYPKQIGKFSVEVNYNYFMGIGSLAFNPDGKILAVEGVDGSFSLWNIAELSNPALIGRSPKQAPRVTKQLSAISFLPEGNVVVATYVDGSFSFWDVSNPASPIQIDTTTSKHVSTIHAIAVNVNDMLLKLGGVDGVLLSFDIRNSKKPVFLEQKSIEHDDKVAVSEIFLSLNGNVLATINYDSNYKFTITLWDVAGAGKPTPLSLPFGYSGEMIIDLDISNNQEYLASEYNVGGINLWNIQDPTHPIQVGYAFAADSFNLRGVQLSPNNDLLISIMDGEVVYWDLSTVSLIRKTCMRVGRNFTQAEWQQYFPGEEYRLTCHQWPAGE